MSTQTRCPDCGWTSTPTTPAHAENALRRHSCQLHRVRTERAARVEARRTDPGVRRDCTHPIAQHRHGTHAAYVLDRCRCRACRDATAAYEARRQRQSAYGRWQPYVPASHARAHVLMLGRAGMGWKRVAQAAGLSPSVVWKLIYGDPSRGQAPSKRVRAATAQKLLAVRLDIADGARVDGTGTTRRIQALIALGWSQSKLAHRLGINSPANFTGLVHGRENTTAARAAQVRTLYDQLWDQAPPETNQRDRIAASRARRYSAAAGWPPPAAWDDDTIDDPDAQPWTATGEPVVDEFLVDQALQRRSLNGLTEPDRLAAVRALLDQGVVEPGSIAYRLGTSTQIARRLLALATGTPHTTRRSA